ncbi:MAG: nodulation protein NfeD [Pseudohongiellaceae bacterium]
MKKDFLFQYLPACLSRIRRWATAAVIPLCLWLPPGIAQDSNITSPTVHVIALDGPIGPASADYVIRSLQDASEAGAELAIIRLNTPGGLDASMRDIISAILDSPVPVATWVAPGGSRAASAGTYITYASHIAAMAPATNIGSSTPVSMGGTPTLPGSGGEEDTAPDEENGEAEDAGPTNDMERKVINDAVAYIRGLAELRGRNADWAESSVRQAANLSASEALENGVIDLIAPRLETLLEQLDGRSVEIGDSSRILNLAEAEIVQIEPDWRYEFLGVITNPNVAYILLMIGIYGIILEFYNPGTGLPGITGVICLVLAGFALQMLPISYAGLALLLVGLILMILEVLSPSFGVLGVGGLAAFVLGSVMLMDTDLPAYQISMPLIAALAVGTAAFVMLVLGAVVQSRRQRLTSGTEAMIGTLATALEDFERSGHVRADGEIWQAVCDEPVSKDDRLRIDRVEGLELHVRRAPSS